MVFTSVLDLPLQYTQAAAEELLPTFLPTSGEEADRYWRSGRRVQISSRKRNTAATYIYVEPHMHIQGCVSFQRSHAKIHCYLYLTCLLGCNTVQSPTVGQCMWPDKGAVPLQHCLMADVPNITSCLDPFLPRVNN